jgi:hypothetical protein
MMAPAAMARTRKNLDSKQQAEANFVTISDEQGLEDFKLLMN